MISTNKLFIVAAILLICFRILQAGDRMKGPPQRSDTLAAIERYGSGHNEFIDVYQKFISPVKGGNLCPMYPSCSQYAKIALGRYGIVRAYPMIFERIMQCGRDLYLYPIDTIDNTTKWHDPVH
ncbi:MAG: membrane protein insertion efficiency factor YidD [Chitinispirillaceae bacterium]|jgi:putative component of membrane protein insertase Oxa1/YidC/SpoIIIJ protein YidD